MEHSKKFTQADESELANEDGIFELENTAHPIADYVMTNEQRAAQTEMELVGKQARADLADIKSPWQEVSIKKKKKLKPYGLVLTGNRPTTRASSRASR